MSILKEGRNCWRIGKAKRLSFLIDADAYFRALMSAVDQAEKAVYISGWDIDSRVRLIRSDEDEESPMARSTTFKRRPMEVWLKTWEISSDSVGAGPPGVNWRLLIETSPSNGLKNLPRT